MQLSKLMKDNLETATVEELNAVGTNILSQVGSTLKDIPSKLLAQRNDDNIKCHVITDNPEYVYAIVDSNNVILFGVKNDGSIYWQKGMSKEISDAIRGLGVLNEDFYGKVYEQREKQSSLIYAILDNDGGILLGINDRGKLVNSQLYKDIESVSRKIATEKTSSLASKTYVDTEVNNEKIRAMSAEASLQSAIDSIEPTIVQGGSNNPDQIFLTSISDSVTFKDMPPTINGRAVRWIHPSRSVDMTNSNMVYIIAGAVDLGGKTIHIPEGCELYFTPSGCIVNGTIGGNGTKISGWKKNIFSQNTTIQGTWNVPHISSGMIKDSNEPNALKFIEKLLNDNVYNDVVIEEGDYWFTRNESASNLISMKSNTKLHIIGNIHFTPNSYNNAVAISCSGKRNIEIYGGKIIGDIDEHDYSSGGTHEQCHHIVINSDCVNCNIHDIAFEDSVGDGVYVAANNVEIHNCTFKKCGRNCISITKGSRIKILNCDFDTCKRTDPKMFIDIEPNGNDRVDHVLVENIKAKDCPNGFMIQHADNVVFKNVSFSTDNSGGTWMIIDSSNNVGIENVDITAPTTSNRVSIAGNTNVYFKNVSFVTEPNPTAMTLTDVYVDPTLVVNGKNVLSGSVKSGSTSVIDNKLMVFTGSSWITIQ